jgi:hypothetical protein
MRAITRPAFYSGHCYDRAAVAKLGTIRARTSAPESRLSRFWTGHRAIFSKIVAIPGSILIIKAACSCATPIAERTGLH